MSDPTAQEPTMEEILASIRRIISEDDAPPAAEAAPHTPAAAPAPPPAPAVVHAAPEPTIEEEDEDDVLELNEPARPPRETHGDLDVFEKPKAVEPAPEPKVEIAPLKVAEPPPAPAYAPIVDESYDHSPAGGGLVSGQASAAAASHFGALSQSIAMPPTGRTLEDVVSDLLKPLLKDWLDEHLPSMVEQAVRDEVERISRRRVY
jgi:cell pole-organizing protein PopZ